ncbi:MAG TPA: HepT-like ribonuclease domain-containing protein [Allosphingosinicella sp.]|nr:HepT-like ribonuclease domain-containing protein [Allosphingosinicella sp.]
MNLGPEADALYLDEIVELVQLVRESLVGTSQAEFLLDRTKGDATALRLGAIGEASRKLSRELQERHPEIEWRKMYGLRNIVAHHYRRLNYRILWQIATETLEPLDEACRDELARLGE